LKIALTPAATAPLQLAIELLQKDELLAGVLFRDDMKYEFNIYRSPWSTVRLFSKFLI
jgi:hypothetical protein